MNDLKELFIELKFQNIRTYIQSGNVLFNTSLELSDNDLSITISDAINERFSIDTAVIIIEMEKLKKIIANLPFKEYLEKNIYITFTNQKTEKYDLFKILDKKNEDERIEILEDVIYLECPSGYGNTKLSNKFLEKQLNTTCTTRNLKTCKALLKF